MVHDDREEARRLASARAAMYLSGGGVPVIEVTRWGFVRFPDEPLRRGVNVVGAEDGYARISSAVLGIDTGQMVAKTVSGRIYLLTGEPDPEYALQVPKEFGRLRHSRCELVDLETAVSEAAYWNQLIREGG